MKRLATIMVIVGLFAWGCAKKQAVVQKEPIAQAQQEIKAPEPPVQKPEPKLEFKAIYFDLDSYELKDEYRKILSEVSVALRGKPSATIRLEGHCDERGTIEYNLALGEKRANAVREYLMNLGISGEALKTVSYGKERPAALGHDEASWAKNRRVEFIIEKQ